MIKTNELREMTITELQNKLLELRKHQFNLRLRKANGTLDKPHIIKTARREIAQIKTILSEKGGKNDK